MSDVSKTNEARQEAAETLHKLFPGYVWNHYLNAVDALEAATRVPVQGEPRCETCNDVGLVGSDHMNSGNCPDCNPYVMPPHELYRTNIIDVINRAANEWTLQREVLYPRNNVTQAQHIVRRVAELRDPAVQGEPNDEGSPIRVGYDLCKSLPLGSRVVDADGYWKGRTYVKTGESTWAYFGSDPNAETCWGAVREGRNNLSPCPIGYDAYVLEPHPEPTEDREALRKEFEYRIRTAVAYGSGLGYRELPVQERADWIQREIRNAVAIASRTTVPDAATEAKQPDGWSNEDAQAAADQAFARWSTHDERDVWNRNGFRLGAEWQKARETFISYKSIADEARAERDAALAAVERLRNRHRKIEASAVTGDCATEECEHEEECPTEIFEVCSACWNLCESADPYFGERGIEPVLWPCPTVAALDGAPEPEWEGAK